MKKPSKKKMIVTILSTILGFSIFISTSSYYRQDINNGHVKKDSDLPLREAGHWIVPPFAVNGDSGWATINNFIV